MDILIGNWKADQPSLLLLNTGLGGNGNGNATHFFQTIIELPGREMNTRSIATKDVDNDGYVDLIVGNWGQDQPNQLIMNNQGIGVGEVFDLPGGTMETRTLAVTDVVSLMFSIY